MLAFTPKKGAELVHKVLESAIANAENNHSADIDELKVSTIHGRRRAVVQALPRARKGRGNRISSATATSRSRRRRQDE